LSTHVYTKRLSLSLVFVHSKTSSIGYVVPVKLQNKRNKLGFGYWSDKNAVSMCLIGYNSHMVWLKTSVHFVIEFVLHVVLYYFRKMVQQLSTSSNSNQTTTADLWARKKVNNTQSSCV